MTELDEILGHFHDWEMYVHDPEEKEPAPGALKESEAKAAISKLIAEAEERSYKQGVIDEARCRKCDLKKLEALSGESKTLKDRATNEYIDKWDGTAPSTSSKPNERKEKQ